MYFTLKMIIITDFIYGAIHGKVPFSLHFAFNFQLTILRNMFLNCFIHIKLVDKKNINDNLNKMYLHCVF